MNETVVLVISMMTLGQITLCVPILFSKGRKTPLYFPLAIFLVANGIACLDPAIELLANEEYSIYIAFIFPAWLVMAPALWFYVKGLTAETPWRFERHHLVSFIPFGLGVIITVLLLTLPVEDREAIFRGTEDVDSGRPLLAVLSIFLLMVLWAVQSSYYLVKIAKRLSKYRKALKNHFASHERKELHWLSWFLIIVVSTWVLFLANLLSTLFVEHTLFDRYFGALLQLILVWSISYGGLKQKPGFDGNYLTEKSLNTPTEIEKLNKNEKYERSALGEEQAGRIANKLNLVMQEQQLFLQSGLTLQQLSKHISISPNYISQTLNETMNSNFFDFVNKWRVNRAKSLLQTGEETVLNIALEVGFNARSSFYKAFKKETGMTPSEYRQGELHATNRNCE